MVVWNMSGHSSAITSSNNTSASFGDIFKKLLSSSNFDADLFVVLCYFLWIYRNKTLFEGVKVDSVLFCIWHTKTIGKQTSGRNDLTLCSYHDPGTLPKSLASTLILMVLLLVLIQEQAVVPT